MAIFQKIAASSFAAVYRTLRRRLISITIRELINHEENRNVAKRDTTYQEAIYLVKNEFGFNDDSIGLANAERIVIDYKRKLLKKIQIEENDLSEINIQGLEDDVLSLAQYTLPEEKNRIYELLEYFPKKTETKALNLLLALQKLWSHNPEEKIVIFATYLGTVEMIETLIDNEFPNKGVVVLKGGDHGAKQSAENKFNKNPGPKVMFCTAAGREGINLQHARILFNFDLPWNPMDMEQRIGRIHRYGQLDTAQVYNLVLSDTIEGKIYLLLENKLKEIARALGKMQNDQIAEDFQSQILGQLSEKLNYDKMYREALNDPELKRTNLELEIAMKNAREAREVVFELFQDLDRFNLDDYQKISENKVQLEELILFLKKSIEFEGGVLEKIDEENFKAILDQRNTFLFNINRDLQSKNDLVGIDHPLVKGYIDKYKNIDSDRLGLILKNSIGNILFSLWYIEVRGEKGERSQYLLPIVLENDYKRNYHWESNYADFFKLIYNSELIEKNKMEISILHDIIEPIIQKEISHKGWLSNNQGYQMKLIKWIQFFE